LKFKVSPKNINRIFGIKEIIIPRELYIVSLGITKEDILRAYLHKTNTC
jgi:hypothetical protein